MLSWTKSNLARNATASPQSQPRPVPPCLFDLHVSQHSATIWTRHGQQHYNTMDCLLLLPGDWRMMWRTPDSSCPKINAHLIYREVKLFWSLTKYRESNINICVFQISLLWDFHGQTASSFAMSILSLSLLRNHVDSFLARKMGILSMCLVLRSCGLGLTLFYFLGLGSFYLLFGYGLGLSLIFCLV
jgi:hypothetical protein